MKHILLTAILFVTACTTLIEPGLVGGCHYDQVCAFNAANRATGNLQKEIKP